MMLGSYSVFMIHIVFRNVLKYCNYCKKFTIFLNYSPRNKNTIDYIAALNEISIG